MVAVNVDPNNPVYSPEQLAQMQETRKRREDSLRKRLEEHKVDEGDPRVRPFVEDFRRRRSAADQSKEDHTKEIEDARHRYDEASRRVQGAQEAAARANQELNDALSVQSEASNRVGALHGNVLMSAEPTPAELLAPSEETEMMFFPRETRLITDRGQATFPPGIHPVPKSIVTHPFLWNSGARLYSGTTEGYQEGTEWPPASSPARTGDPNAQRDRAQPPHGGTDLHTQRD